MPQNPSLDDLDVIARVDAVAAALDELRGRFGAGQPTTTVFLEQLCRWAVDTIPGADMAGITLVGSDGTATTPAYTDPRVVEIGVDQYRTGQGPCLEAAATHTVVRVRFDELPDCWPPFAAAVRRLGVRSYLCAPLRLADDHIGTLNLYSVDGDGFSDLDAALLKIYTTVGETIIGLSRDLDRARRDVAGLRTAMESRAVIEQAKGALMFSRGIGEDAAFQALVDASQRENVKLAAVAQRIVALLGSRS
ncbi:GAF and ANTAR domain-containing protein [Rhodococcus artemisiae]|uniref:GAF and ANTAR domain-containing protein n=1 Tax=Rhodococcus artemisiae TaxID=714159 RepID=A0ABU7LIT8_9NOCA|nr:GAF and ANTAR domain-containing protein [Rhodococcus artemisiae]MEE2061470.1 GAF and ANTAR domain-containing protein [Rhodococcus artemisiae]